MTREFVPRPYQQIMIDHMLEHRRCALWASLGSGKSAAVLSALDTLALVESGPALVLAPKRVAESVWSQEASKWGFGMRVVPVLGSAKEKLAALSKPADIYATNFESIPLLVEHYGGKWPFRTIVADESTRLKGFRSRQGSVRAKALARVAHSRVGRFIELTGTPAPMGLIDLWPQAYFLDRGARLGSSFTAFTDRWFKSTQVGDSQFARRLDPLPHAQGEIMGLLGDICLSVDVRDYHPIGKPIITDVMVDIPAKARALYAKMEREFFAEFASGQSAEAVNAAAKSSKCLQIAAGAVYTDDGGYEEIHDAKIQALDSIIEEAAGAPVLVAYYWRHDLERLKRAFPQGRELDAQAILDWSAGKVPLMFIHPASAGHGLSLQDGGNILVFFSAGWSLENYQQVIERIGPTRQFQAGYDRPVFVYRIQAADTLDAALFERLEGKASIQDAILNFLKRKH